MSVTHNNNYGISARMQQIMWTFFLGQIQRKLMTKFSNKSKKLYFWYICGTKIFLKKSRSVTHNNNYGISARMQPIMWNFFLDQIQKKLMTTFSNKSKKSYFWYIFWTKKRFENIPLYHAQQHHAEFQKKLMRRKNFRTEGRKDGGTERRTDRP